MTTCCGCQAQALSRYQHLNGFAVSIYTLYSKFVTLGLQAWLVVLLLITGRSQSPFLVAGGVVLLTVISLPPRLWRAQLKRLGLLALFLYVTTALFAGETPHSGHIRLLEKSLLPFYCMSRPTESDRS